MNLRREPSYLWALTILLASTGAAAADPVVDYQLGVAAGQRNIDYDSTHIASGTVWRNESGDLRPGFAGAKVKYDFSELLYTAAVNGTALYKDFYLSFSFEWAISSEDTGLKLNAEPIPGPGIPLALNNVTDFEVDRIDYGATFGYRVWRELSLFGGYKYSEFELNSIAPNLLLEEVDTKYTEEGFFLGGSYGFRIANAGTLSFSVGYAYLDSDFSQSNISTMAPAFAFSFEEYRFSGSSTGLSYGVLWTGNLTGRWHYTLGLKHQQYRLKNSSTSQGMLIGEDFPPGDPGGALHQLRHTTHENQQRSC